MIAGRNLNLENVYRELSYVFRIVSEVNFKAQIPETAFGSTFETTNFLCSGPR